MVWEKRNKLTTSSLSKRVLITSICVPWDTQIAIWSLTRVTDYINLLYQWHMDWILLFPSATVTCILCIVPCWKKSSCRWFVYIFLSEASFLSVLFKSKQEFVAKQFHIRATMTKFNAVPIESSVRKRYCCKTLNQRRLKVFFLTF